MRKSRSCANAFIKDESLTIADLLKEAVSELGESIRIRRFAPL